MLPRVPPSEWWILVEGECVCVSSSCFCRGTTAESLTEDHLKSSFVKLQRTGLWNRCIVMNWIWKYLVFKGVVPCFGRQGGWDADMMRWHCNWGGNGAWDSSSWALPSSQNAPWQCSSVSQCMIPLIKRWEWTWGFSVSDWTGDFTFSSSETSGENELEGKGKRRRCACNQIKGLFTLSYS